MGNTHSHGHKDDADRMRGDGTWKATMTTMVGVVRTAAMRSAIARTGESGGRESARTRIGGGAPCSCVHLKGGAGFDLDPRNTPPAHATRSLRRL